MRAEKLYAATGFVTRRLSYRWWTVVGKTSPRPTPTHLLAARTNVHEDGGRDDDAPHVLHEQSDEGNSGTWIYWR